MRKRKGFIVLFLLAVLVLGGCSRKFSDEIKNMIQTEEKEKREEGESVQQTDIGEDNIIKEDSQTANRDLSIEELKQFTNWLNKVENNGFLLSEYTKPQEVNLGEVLYNGAGIEQVDLSEEERKAYLLEVGFIDTDITRLTSVQIEEFLQKKMGISFKEVINGLDWVYLKKYDSYILQHGDTNWMPFVCTSGRELEENRFVLHCKAQNDYFSDCMVTLEKVEDSYLFVSNQYEVNTEDEKILRCIQDQCFTINLNQFGEVRFTSYAPDTIEDLYNDVVFELQKNGETIYTFPGIGGEYTRVNKIFMQVDAVAFIDYDKDGYQDVIAICSYQPIEDGEMTTISYPEVRIYKGTEIDFRYLDQLSFTLNSEGCNQNIAQVREKIELPEVDLSALEEKVQRQLEVFADTRQEWLFHEAGPSICGYAVCDLDEDGRLELIAQTTQGTGLFSENHFYQVNNAGDGILEIPQKYYSQQAELDIGISSMNFFAYKDKETGIIYYPASDITKNGYAETYQAEGVYYLKENCIYSLIYRMQYTLLKKDDTTEETYFDAEGNEISKTEWEQLYQNFFHGKEVWKDTINWKNMYSQDYEAASYQEVLRILIESYTLNTKE